MRHFKLIYLVLFYIPVSVKAAMCFVDADNGVRYYRMKGDKTAYLSARADAIKPFNQEGLSFQPNQATAQCVKQALIACDPSFGALPVYGSRVSNFIKGQGHDLQLTVSQLSIIFKNTAPPQAA